MGNKLGRRRQVVDEKYTRPQGLYQHMDVDHKKLRKLILDSKLAPCYPGDDDSTRTFDLEECPICFLYYPSLNRSRCCMKGICTECFLQMKTPHSVRPTQCPFCKTSNYAVEYRGKRTNEEKGKEQIVCLYCKIKIKFLPAFFINFVVDIGMGFCAMLVISSQEEQRVIEAKIRMQIEERYEQEQSVQKRQAVYPSSSTIMIPTDVEYHNLASSSMPASVQPSTHNREDEFDTDLEEMMVMKAILLSMQDQDTCSRNHTTLGSDSSTGSDLSDSSSRDNCASRTLFPAEISSSSNDLAYTAATATASQHVSLYPANSNGVTSSSFSIVSPNFSCFPFPTEDERSLGDYTKENWSIEVSEGNSTGTAASSSDDVSDRHRFEQASAGTSYDVGSENALHSGAAALPCLYTPNIPSGHLLHEFEEQMMLAMAVSLADARTRTNSHGTT